MSKENVAERLNGGDGSARRWGEGVSDVTPVWNAARDPQLSLSDDTDVKGASVIA